MEKLLQPLGELLGRRQPCVLATVVRSSGSVPGKAGSRILVWAEGQRGTVGGGPLEYRVVQEAHAILRESHRAPEVRCYDLAEDLGMSCGGTVEIFFEPLERPARLVIFGGGHIGRPLSLMATEADFRVIVVDEREELASLERFPGAQEVRARVPAEFCAGFESDEDTYFVVATHRHERDEEAVRSLLPMPSAFLGVVGSRSKRASFEKGLQDHGFSAEDTARLQMPVGIPIGGNAPAEIAVSILAQLITVRGERRIEGRGSGVRQGKIEASGGRSTDGKSEKKVLRPSFFPCIPGRKS